MSQIGMMPIEGGYNKGIIDLITYPVETTSSINKQQWRWIAIVGVVVILMLIPIAYLSYQSKNFMLMKACILYLSSLITDRFNNKQFCIAQ